MHNGFQDKIIKDDVFDQNILWRSTDFSRLFECIHSFSRRRVFSCHISYSVLLANKYMAGNDIFGNYSLDIYDATKEEVATVY